MNDGDLDRLLAEMAADLPAPSEGLMARVLEDALRERPAPGAVRSADRRAGVVEGIFQAIGGWLGAGGLVTAGLVGLWVGMAPPEAVETGTQAVWNAISPDLTGGWTDFGTSL